MPELRTTDNNVVPMPPGSGENMELTQLPIQGGYALTHEISGVPSAGLSMTTPGSNGSLPIPPNHLLKPSDFVAADLQPTHTPAMQFGSNPSSERQSQQVGAGSAVKSCLCCGALKTLL